MDCSKLLILLLAGTSLGCSAEDGTDPIDIAEISDAGRADLGHEIDTGGRDSSSEDTGADWFKTYAECPTDDPDFLVVYPEGPSFAPVNGDLGVDSRILKSTQEPLGEAGLLLTLQASGTNNSRSGSRGWVINRPGDIGFSMAISTTEPLASDTTITLTTLMDYEGVETNWELVGQEDFDIEKSESSEGFQVDFNEPVEVIHGTIPYEAFSEPGYHELVVSFAAAGPSQFVTTNVRRYSIWNQSGSRLPHRCFVRQEATPNTETEITMRSFLNGQSSVSYLEGEQDQAHLRESVVARPGEQLTARYFVSGVAQYKLQEYRAAVVPVLNGVPLTETDFIITPIVEEDASVRPVYRETVFRDRVTFEAPEQPGEYDFHALVVLNAFNPRTTPDGLYVEDFRPLAGSFAAKMRILVRE